MSTSMWPAGTMAALAGGGSGATVSWDGHTRSNDRTGATCTTRWQCNSDGDKYISNNVGSLTSYKTWLLTGLNSEVWIERTITSGSLTTDDIGSGRVSCSSDLTLGVQQTSVGTKRCIMTVEFFDQASGGSAIATGTLDITANYDF